MVFLSQFTPTPGWYHCLCRGLCHVWYGNLKGVTALDFAGWILVGSHVLFFFWLNTRTKKLGWSKKRSCVCTTFLPVWGGRFWSNIPDVFSKHRPWDFRPFFGALKNRRKRKLLLSCWGQEVYAYGSVLETANVGVWGSRHRLFTDGFFSKKKSSQRPKKVEFQKLLM